MYFWKKKKMFISCQLVQFRWIISRNNKAMNHSTWLLISHNKNLISLLSYNCGSLLLPVTAFHSNWLQFCLYVFIWFATVYKKIHLYTASSYLTHDIYYFYLIESMPDESVNISVENKKISPKHCLWMRIHAKKWHIYKRPTHMNRMRNVS